MVIVVLQTLRLDDERLALIVVQSCTVLFLFLGLNHAFAFAANPGAQFHWPPLVLNFVGFFFGMRLFPFRRGD